jgi:hypothetical protein
MIDLFAVADLQPLVGAPTFDVDLAAAAREVATGVVLATCHLTDVPTTPPAGLVAVGKRVAARLYSNPTDLRAETSAGYAATYAARLLDADDRLVLELVAAQLQSFGRAKSVTLGY